MDAIGAGWLAATMWLKRDVRHGSCSWEQRSASREEQCDESTMCLTCSSSRAAAHMQHSSLLPPLSIHVQPTFTAPLVSTLEDLGISLDTFRQIRLLQMRDITENDYDLLMRLHTKSATKVLESHQLHAVTDTFLADAAWVRSNEGTCAVCLCAMSPGKLAARTRGL